MKITEVNEISNVPPRVTSKIILMNIYRGIVSVTKAILKFLGGIAHAMFEESEISKHRLKYQKFGYHVL